MRIAVFGGTFDPPHKGHIKIAEEVLDGNLADKVLFIPAYKPPHKTGYVITPFEHRLAMLKLALKGRKGFDASDIEMRRYDLLSYTYDTLRELSGIYPYDKIILLIGGDSLRQLHTWHRAADIVAAWDFIVYPRPGDVITKDELLEHWRQDIADKLFTSVRELPLLDISSTEIRKLAGNRKSIKDCVDHTVYDYIIEHDFYAEN